MKEHEVTKAVCDYFTNKGYFVIRGKFNVGVIPDVVAFKWNDDGYTIDCIAVECKGKKPKQVIVNTALQQAISYQKFFPKVYIACPVPSPTLPKWISELFRVGFIPVDKRGVDDNSIEEASISLRLNDVEFIRQVRNRAALLLAYMDLLGSSDFQYSTMEPGYIWCSTQRGLGLTTHNTRADGDFHAGVNLEIAKEVMRRLTKIPAQHLYKELKDLPEEYAVLFCAIETYRPREIRIPLLHKTVKELSKEDVVFLCDEARRREGKIWLFVYKTVWRWNEILGRKEHLKRISDVREETRELFKLLGGQDQ